MDPQRWEQVQALFHQALEQPASARSQFVHAIAGSDGELAAAVTRLLEGDAQEVPLLNQSVADVASELLDYTPAIASLGPYRVIRKLGEGGMAVVLLAERDDIGGFIAIKLLRDAALSPARRQRFASEQRALAKLVHPHIASLYDAGTLSDGTPYILMEHVDGVTITQYCEQTQCSIAERLRLFRDLCEAVQFVHRHAIVHRDLKPSNVLVTSDRVVKLLDFGISKQLDATDDSALATQTSVRLLTPAYAAPEQVWGEPIGTYTDIYTLGIILYELLTGKLPFEARAHRHDAQLLQEEPPRPSTLARRTAAGAELGRAQWADLDVLCLNALQKDPQRRYHSVDALMRDVDHYLNNQPLDARPDSIAYRAGKFVRRNRAQVTLAAVATAALIALAGFYTVRLTDARDDALAEAARSERVQRFMLNLFEGGDPSAGPADTLRVVTVVDRGLREARLLDREPVLQAELFATLGGIYQKLGNVTRADSLLQTALRQRRAIAGKDSADVATNLIALGMLRADQAELDEAETLVRAGLATAQRHFAPMHPRVIQGITALGTVLIEQGEYDSARVVLQQALELESSKPDTLVRADILRQLANAHFYTGDYAASDSLNQELLAIHRKVYGPGHPLVAGDLLNLGASQQNRGEYAAAERYHREALAITGNFYGTDHPEYASNLTMVGRALAFQDGKHGEAVTVLTRALHIQEQAYGTSHPRAASALNELGNVAVAQSDYAAAERYFRRIRAIYFETYGPNHQLSALATANLGSVFMNSGDNARAEPLFRDAVQRYTAALSPTHLDVGIARIKLGRVLMRQQRYAEGLRETSAGYEIVKREAAPTVSFLKAARTDLAIMYDSLKQPARAAHFRAEQAAVDAGAKQ